MTQLMMLLFGLSGLILGAAGDFPEGHSGDYSGGGGNSGGGRVVITEIMYNPASDERGGASEWVEIANVGKEPVKIRNWRLDDEDRRDWGKFSCTLAPGGVAILVNEKKVDEKAFRAAWSRGSRQEESENESVCKYQIIPVKWSGLANTPTEENEVLQLLDGEGMVVCEVNYESGGDWPKCNGQSIWLKDYQAKDLNDGTGWKKTVVGKNGAWACRTTVAFNRADIGSPGFVPGLHDEASQPVLGKEEETLDDADDTIDY